MINCVFDSPRAHLELKDSLLLVKFKVEVVNIEIAKKMVEEKLAFASCWLASSLVTDWRPLLI